MNSAREVPTRPSTRGTSAVGREPARCRRRSPSPPTRARVRLIHPLVHPGSKANARCAAPVVGASPGRRGRSVRAAPPPSSLARSRPSRFVSVRRSPATVEPVGVSASACPWPDGVRSTPVSRGPRPPGPARPRRTLSRRVGEALARYLRHARPHTDVREIFLALTAPTRPLSASAISSVVRSRMQRCGIKCPRRGAHALRHAFAQRLLDEGFLMQEIGGCLGHRSLDSTAVYAKVALAGLRQVADFDLEGLA